MSEFFENAPLVELIAEARWQPAHSAFAAQPAQPLQLTFVQPEEFFMRMGMKAGALGFDVSERIVPLGFPALPHQAVYRFRRRDESSSSTLYQVGSGVFTANTTPPYRTWDEFRPIVERGLTALLDARISAEEKTPFSSVLLRYVNAFDNRLRGDALTWSFLHDMLGVTVLLPSIVTEEIEPGQKPTPQISLSIPIRNDHKLALTFADAAVNGIQSTLVDIVVSKDGPINPALDSLMETFDRAHSVIHKVFFGMTTKLHKKMKLAGI